MEKTKFKSKISTIALILLLTISALIVALPTATAQYVYSKTTHAYIGATPNPIGINQQVLLHIGITDYLNIVTDGWEGLTATVTKPDGSTETLGPFRTDSTGGTGTIFVPTLVGTYTFQTHFPEQAYTWTTPPLFDPELNGAILYKASNSEILELTVTEEAQAYYQPTPLPTEYWTRPIDGQHREWSTIAGNWLERPVNSYAPYNDYAPDTAHVLWAKALELGGLAGGDMGEHAFDCGDAYEGKFSGTVVIGGILFYNKMFSGLAGGLTSQLVGAVDLHTGEELWSRPLTDSTGKIHRLAFGQTYYFDNFNYHAVFDYLWATESSFDFATFTFVNKWHAFDPFTGEWVYSMENVPSGSIMFGASTTMRGPQGEILIYNINTAAGWMALWNSSRVIFGDAGGFETGSWRPHGQTWNATRGYQSNITIPTGLPGEVRFVLQDRVVGNDVSGWANIGDQPINQWCVSLVTGDLLWQTTWQPPEGDLGVTWGAASLEDGIFTLQAKETRQVWGFDIDTGHEIWGPTDSMPYLGIYGMISNIAYGKVFVAARMAGVVNAFDAQTGNLVWTYDASDPYNEILWGNNWPVQPVFITDGKIYLGHSEHSPVDPKPRGAPFICLDAEDGTETWRIDGFFRQTDWGGRAVIGDSIMATMDSYDQQIYAVGKGPSATTVGIQNDVIKLGESTILKGKVTDVSPGTEDPAVKLRFPMGVPAITDESMSGWMNYVYKQFVRPADATGVPVKIEIVDPNGAYAWIGTATSDMDGNYAYSFVPQTKGQYMIIATFAGSASYYGSHAITYLTVDSAPPAYPTYPGYQGPSAQDVANSVVASLPADATPQQVAQAVVNAMPEYPEPDPVVIPEYTTMDIILAILIAVAIVIGIVSLLKKK